MAFRYRSDPLEVCNFRSAAGGYGLALRCPFDGPVGETAAVTGEGVGRGPLSTGRVPPAVAARGPPRTRFKHASLNPSWLRQWRRKWLGCWSRLAYLYAKVSLREAS